MCPLSSRATKPSAQIAAPAASASVINPDDLIDIEELAKRLHQTVPWCREKVRARCQNPIPVYSLRHHLLFDWPKVCAWIQSSPRPTYRHRARRKKAKAD
jgi:hypothetical protein